MKLKAAEISDIIRRQIRDYEREIDIAETGTVLSVGDGIARVYGLEKVMAGELVAFDGRRGGFRLLCGALPDLLRGERGRGLELAFG